MKQQVKGLIAGTSDQALNHPSVVRPWSSGSLHGNGRHRVIIRQRSRLHEQLLGRRVCACWRSRLAGRLSNMGAALDQQAVRTQDKEMLDCAVTAHREAVAASARRHIAAIMTRLDVASRFAAGAAAQQHGWP